jgi:ribonuclease HI
MTPEVWLFVDGSCGAKEDYGAWAAIAATVTQRKILYGSMRPTTISRCELTPIIEGLRWIKKEWGRYQALNTMVISDSEYTVKTLCGIYRRRKHLELWAAVDAAAKGLNVRYIWRERNTLPYMTYCDAICGGFRRALIAASATAFQNPVNPEANMPYGLLPETVDDVQFTDSKEQDEDEEEQET